MTIRCMRIACWIPKSKNTHSEYVTLTAFLLQQWFPECASLLRYARKAYLVIYLRSAQIKFRSSNGILSIMQLCLKLLSRVESGDQTQYC
jgi:hypothetical protein